MGMYEEAFREYEQAATAAGENKELAELKAAYQQHGMEGFWRKQLEIQLRPPAKEVDTYFVAYLYCKLGDRDLAWRWLQKSYRERSPHMEELLTDAGFDNLRTDARFADLLRSLHMQ